MSVGLVNPGDKIDITFLHQNNGKTYKSSVFDLLNDKEVEITMPTDEGKMVLFQIGFVGQFYFYTPKGIFTCEAAVTDRCKRDNFYLLTIKIVSPVKKFQRRDYFRVDCSVEFHYYHITAEVAKLETTEALFEEIANPKYRDEKKIATTRDLSGGGVRFTSTEKLEVGDRLLSVMRLTNDKIDHTFYLISEIISCDSIERVKDYWAVRAKFVFKDPKDRDLIVRYVFEEDRMIRKKESGE